MEEVLIKNMTNELKIAFAIGFKKDYRILDLLNILIKYKNYAKDNNLIEYFNKITTLENKISKCLCKL